MVDTFPSLKIVVLDNGAPLWGINSISGFQITDKMLFEFLPPSSVSSGLANQENMSLPLHP